MLSTRRSRRSVHTVFKASWHRTFRLLQVRRKRPRRNIHVKWLLANCPELRFYHAQTIGSPSIRVPDSDKVIPLFRMSARNLVPVRITTSVGWDGG